MLQDDPTLRPIVACRVVSDSESAVHLRVYCPRLGSSVALRACEACAAKIEVTPAGGVVQCGPEGESACHTLAEAPPIGALVETPVKAIDESANLTIAVELLAEAGAEPVLVVDASGQCVGALSRTRLTQHDPFPMLDGPPSSAREAMVDAKVALETTSVRDVLRAMATQRLRYLAIVATDGRPLGVVSDIEALRLFAALRQ